MITSINLIFPMVFEQYRKRHAYLQMPFHKHEHWRKQAKLLKLSKAACTRLEWIIFYETRAKNNASLTCRHFSIAPKTFYKWFNRFDDKNLRSLEDQSRAPKHKRQREITRQEESRIVALRNQRITWGKLKLQRVYRNLYREKISSWKIQYTITKHKLYPNPVKNEKLKQKRKRNQAKKRITELKKQPFPTARKLPSRPRLFNRNLTEWLVKYNFVRPHQTLGQETPWEFTSRHPKVLPMYSSSTST